MGAAAASNAALSQTITTIPKCPMTWPDSDWTPNPGTALH
jgi:hypothetical protein